MVKVTCQIDDYSEPAKPCIKVHSNWLSKYKVDLEICGDRYTVLGYDLIEAIKNAMNTNGIV